MVLGCVRSSELRVLVEPGAAMAEGGVPLDVPAAIVPAELRLPNSRLWVVLDPVGAVLGARAVARPQG